MKTKFERKLDTIGLAFARALLEEATRTAAHPRGPYEIKTRLADLADDSFAIVAGVVSDTTSGIITTAYNETTITAFRKELEHK